MKEHVNKRLVILMMLVCLVTLPWSGRTVEATHPKGSPAHPCVAAKRWKYLFASNAFVFSFTPFTPVAIVFGVGALAAEGYEAIYC
jgi:hypothetical protein